MTDPEPAGRLRNTLYRQETSSRRRLSSGRRIVYRAAVPLALMLLRLWWRSCRVVAVRGTQHLDEALAKAPSLIPCYWHQHQVFCARFLLDARERGLRAGFLVSPSMDGELAAMIVERMGAHVIRGSSTHTGARALRDFYQALVKDAISPVITPDGPRGPRFVFKPGAVLLAQISGRPMLPMTFAASRASLVHWDRFVLPWPFSRVVIAIGEPRYVPRTLSPAELEMVQAEMAERLKALFAEARAALGDKET